MQSSGVRRHPAAWPAYAILLLAALLSPGCDRDLRSVTVYSGRSEKLIGPLLDRFSSSTGIEVKVRYADTSQLTATLMEEAHRTPAELFLAQDAAALGALSSAGLLSHIPSEILERIPARFRSPRGDWVGLSGRARVVVYNVERTSADELPQSLAETADSRFRGRFGLAPGNASFQAHMAAYLARNGKPALEQLLRGMAANEPRIYPKNSPIVEAVINGEIDWGLVNHYYLMRALAENPDAPAQNYVMPEADGSGFVNVSGVGLLRETPPALELLRFLVSDDAQRYFSEETLEYSLVSGMRPSDVSAAGDVQPPQIDFGAVSSALGPTLELIQDSGLTRFQ
jgi:iron(III) transport system substrate-binding protein